MNKVITIGREFGSGGREIGLRLAEKLNIPFYDKEIISLTAQDGGFSPDFVASYEESYTPYFNPSITLGSVFAVYEQPISDKIFLAQTHVIKSLAASGPCVIVGRCADYILRDTAIKVFVYANMEDRIKRKLAMDIGVPEQNMRKHILSVDKKRLKYYQYYTDATWGALSNYHLCVNTSGVGIQGAVLVVLCYLSNIV